MPEGEYKFYKDDRERIKAASMLSSETLRYIEALEAIAFAAHEVWSLTPYNKLSREGVDALNELYEQLAVVNFMDESL